jgi:hypothetical protein
MLRTHRDLPVQRCPNKHLPPGRTAFIIAALAHS